MSENYNEYLKEVMENIYKEDEAIREKQREDFEKEINTQHSEFIEKEKYTMDDINELIKNHYIEITEDFGGNVSYNIID